MGRPATLRVDVITDASKSHASLAATESKFSKFGATAAKAGKLAALGFGAGVAGAAVMAVKFAKAAAEDELGAAKLARTLRNAAGATDTQVAATERWITKQGQALGVADDDLRPALSRLTAATGDVGKAQKLATLAMDVSAGTGKSLEAVTTALAKAQNGSVGGLARLGAKTKDAAGHTLSLDQITAQLAKTHAGAASTAANTAAGQYDRLKLMLSETGESIGAHLLPAGTALLGWATKMGPGAQQLADNIGSKLGPVMHTIGGFISDTLVPAGRQLYAWFVDKIAPGIKATVTPILNALRGAFANVQASIERNKPQLDQLRQVLAKVAEFVANNVAPILGKLSGTTFKVLGKSIGIAIDLVAGLTQNIAWLVDKIKALVDWFGRIHVPKALSQAAGFVGGLFSAPTTRGMVSLVGQSPSYDSRVGITAAAGGGSTFTRFLGGSSPAPAGAGVTIDARTYVQVDGALDEVAVAAKLDELLTRHRRRLGRAA